MASSPELWEEITTLNKTLRSTLAEIPQSDREWIEPDPNPHPEHCTGARCGSFVMRQETKGGVPTDPVQLMLHSLGEREELVPRLRAQAQFLEIGLHMPAPRGALSTFLFRSEQTQITAQSSRGVTDSDRVCIGGLYTAQTLTLGFRDRNKILSREVHKRSLPFALETDKDGQNAIEFLRPEEEETSNLLVVDDLFGIAAWLNATAHSVKEALLSWEGNQA